MDENDFEIPIARHLHFVRTLNWSRIAVNGLELKRSTFQVCNDKELSSCEWQGVLSFLMQFDIHIAINWQPTIDSEIKQIRSVHTGRRPSLFFSSRVQLEQLRILISNTH